MWLMGASPEIAPDVAAGVPDLCRHGHTNKLTREQMEQPVLIKV